MKSKTHTISIGIPAYNEESNIKQLLTSVLEQKGSGFRIKEVLVFSDGSTDRTAERVRSIHDKRIKLVADTDRLGKSARLNQIFETFSGDVLILMDADIKIRDAMLFQKIMNRSTLQRNGIISVNTTPLEGKTLFERIINYSVQIQMDLRKQWNKGNNYLAYNGRFLVLEKALAKSINIKQRLVNHDALLYFSAVKKKYVPQYISELSIYYRSPASLKDHIGQSNRFQISQNELKTKLPKHAEDAYMIPRLILLTTLVKYFVLNPFYFISYLLIYQYSKVVKKNNVRSKWSVSLSTKVI